MKTAPCPVEFELRDVQPADPLETVRRGSRLVSRKVGLIRRVVETSHQAQDPLIFTAGVVPADYSRSVNGGLSLNAGGAGDTPAAALAAAIGEAVERHCACFTDPDAVIVGTFSELAADAVSPDRLRLFSREQIASSGPSGPRYFDDRSRIGWVWGYSLTHRRPRLVPASLVYLNYQPSEGESDIGLNASTGLAAGTTREQAILSGLLETVERDAFTTAWLHRRAGRRIVVDDDGVAQVLRRQLWSERPSVDLKFFDLTTDVPIPVVFAIMRRQVEHGPVVCVGASCRLSPRQAVVKCAQEGAQNFPYLRHLADSKRDWQPAADYSNVVDFDCHFLTYFRRPDLVPTALAFFDACTERVELSQVPDRSTGRVLGDLEYCITRLSAAGYEVIVTDLTTPDVAEVGFSAVRVIVPGLVPLHGDHSRPFLGARRLFEIPEQLGWPRMAEQGLNPLPHPFP